MSPPFGAVPGDVVTVINLPGCPKANVMSMCHIALAGQFAGMVCTNSLVPVAAKRRETVKAWAKRRAAVAPQTAGGGL
jgi:ABC-type uncharacterized transport system YnjBCD ATPase subunit